VKRGGGGGEGDREEMPKQGGGAEGHLTSNSSEVKRPRTEICQEKKTLVRGSNFGEAPDRGTHLGR